MTDQHLTSQFLDAAKQPPKPVTWMYCPKCMIRKDYVLVAETEKEEIYRCPDCMTEKQFTVR
jgi:hypothetical protein